VATGVSGTYQFRATARLKLASSQEKKSKASLSGSYGRCSFQVVSLHLFWDAWPLMAYLAHLYEGPKLLSANTAERVSDKLQGRVCLTLIIEGSV